MSIPELTPYILWGVTTLVAVGAYVQLIRTLARDVNALRDTMDSRARAQDLERVERNLNRLERRFDEGPKAIMTALEMIDRRLQRLERHFDQQAVGDA